MRWRGAGARVELQAKEGELRDAYERLAVGARERADVRAALVASQSELAGARAELEAWAQARMDAGQAAARAAGDAAEVRPPNPDPAIQCNPVAPPARRRAGAGRAPAAASPRRAARTPLSSKLT